MTERVCRYRPCCAVFPITRRDHVYCSKNCGKLDRYQFPGGMQPRRLVRPEVAHHDAKLDGWADDDLTCCGHRVQFDTDRLGQVYSVCGVCGVHPVRRRVAT